MSVLDTLPTVSEGVCPDRVVSVDRLCQDPDLDPSIFFDPRTWDEVREAAAICGRCPSLDWCLEYGDRKRGDVYGVIGGRFYREKLTDDPDKVYLINSRPPRDIVQVWGQSDFCLNCGGDKPSPRQDHCNRSCYVEYERSRGGRLN